MPVDRNEIGQGGLIKKIGKVVQKEKAAQARDKASHAFLHTCDITFPLLHIIALDVVESGGGLTRGYLRGLQRCLLFTFIIGSSLVSIIGGSSLVVDPH
jgi:hypothetical protein